MTNPFDEGIEAYCDLADANQVPYERGTTEHDKWLNGYYSYAAIVEDESKERQESHERMTDAGII